MHTGLFNIMFIAVVFIGVIGYEIHKGYKMPKPPVRDPGRQEKTFKQKCSACGVEYLAAKAALEGHESFCPSKECKIEKNRRYERRLKERAHELRDRSACNDRGSLGGVRHPPHP
jgi:hypothetical protein